MTTRPVTFVHSSDWQLGMTRHYLGDEAQARFTGDRIHTIHTIGEVAKREGAEFIVVAGDVFEHANLPARDIGRACEAMGEVGLPIFLLPGNHDPLGPGSLWHSEEMKRALPKNVTLLDSTDPVEAAPGVEIIGVPWHSKNPGKDPVTGALNDLAPTDKIRILVGHGMLKELDPSSQSSTEYVDSAALRAAIHDGLVTYVALGDRHICWIDDETGAINYSGTHETTSFREPDRGTVLVVKVDDGVTATKHEVGTWLHTTVERNIDSSDDVQLLAEDLASIRSKDRTIVQTILTGSLSIAAAAELDTVLENSEHLLASLGQWERHTDLTIVPDEADADSLGLTGFAADAFAELSERAQSGDTVAADALKLLYRIGANA